MKTLAIRLDDDVHARLTILAKLADLSVTDTIRQAIECQIATMASNPELSVRAEHMAAEIEREANDQRQALTDLFGRHPATSATSRPKSPTNRATSAT